MPTLKTIVPCLWFDSQAEEAANFYVATFPDSRITQVARYPNAGQEVHGQAEGRVMTVAFDLAGQSFTALNGGPLFKFSEAISLQVMCADQDEIDRYWTALTADPPAKPSQCGWLKDRYGLSWQIVPAELPKYLNPSDRAQSARVMAAVMKMAKIDLAAIRAAAGDAST